MCFVLFEMSTSATGTRVLFPKK